MFDSRSSSHPQAFGSIAPLANSACHQALRLSPNSHLDQFDSTRLAGNRFRAGSSYLAAFSDDRHFAGVGGANARSAALDAGASIGALAPSTGVRVTTSDFVGNNRGTAYNIGDLNNFNFNWNDSVSNSDADDYFRIRMTNSGTANFSLTGLSADADIFLYNSSGTQIAYSNLGGAANESISRFLSAGTYYLQVHSFAGSTTNYHLTTSGAGPATDPGSNRFSAHDLGNVSRGSRSWNDYVGNSDTSDWHHFELSESANWHLSLTGLSADADVRLYNSNGAQITYSNRGGTTNESINQFLTAGDYYVQVYQYSGSTNYSLRLNADTPAYYGTRTESGTLGADRFDFTGNYARTVVSGNGNVDFGSGLRDTLDLTNLLSTSVSFDYANTAGGGVLYNSGNGIRVFDAINLNDGRQILFEGIDTVRFADRTINLAVTPNDPLFNQQWNLHMMGVQDAWRFTTGSNNVLIGVEDTGLGADANGAIHFDLRTTTVYSNNYQDDYFRVFTSTQKTTSHGTDVQGIIAANSNNGIGMAGINWNSRVFAIDVLDGNANDQSLAEATQNMINDATSHGQRLVINMSLGGGGIPTEFRNLVANNQNNALFVIASGNDDAGSISDPASLASQYSNVIAVGASWGRTDWYGNSTNPGDRISYPGWWGSNYGSGLTLMAPSEVIATNATRNSSTGAVSFGFDTQFNGTSAATPNVTGVASLVWSANSSLSAVQVQQILSQTAVDLGATGYDTTTGNGMVNADAAVRRAMAMSRGAA
jgi:hypothetical protein